MAKTSTITLKQSEDFFTLVGKVFSLIGESVNALIFNLWTFIVAAILIPVASIGLFVAAYASTTAAQDGSALEVIGIVVSAAVGAAGLIVLILSGIAFIRIQLASVRQQKISVKEAYAGSRPFFWLYVGQNILLAIFVLAGLIALIIPGLLVIFFTVLAPYVLIDKKTSILDSLKGSFEIVKSNWKIVLAFVVLQMFISLVGAAPLIGWAISWALTIAYLFVLAIIYEQTKKSFKPTKSAATK